LSSEQNSIRFNISVAGARTSWSVFD